MKIPTRLLILSLSLIVACATNYSIPFKSNNLFIDKISKIAVNEKLILASSNSKVTILGSYNNLLKSKSIAQKFDIVKDIAILSQDCYVATGQGLYCSTSLSDFKLIPLQAKVENPIISDILIVGNEVYFSAPAFGLFKVNGNKAETVLLSAGINSLTSTKDSTLWLGTNYGLIAYKNGISKRFSEEISKEGIALPEMSINKVYTDFEDKLWVITDNYITIFENNNEHNHLPSFPLVSKKINGFTSYKSENQFYYLFATLEGLYILFSDSKSTENEEYNQSLFTFEDNSKEVNDIFVDEKYFYFSTDTKVHKLEKDEFIKSIRK
jgi:ligand-binding sensor domain-containing protein